MTVAGDQFTASKDVRPVIKEASPVSQEHHRVRHPAEGCEDPSTVLFKSSSMDANTSKRAQMWRHGPIHSNVWSHLGSGSWWRPR